MPKLKCAHCGQKKSDFTACKSCGTKYCKDCLLEAIRKWPDIIKNLEKVPPKPYAYYSPLLHLKTHPGNLQDHIRGCCVKNAELYIIQELDLEELPPLIGYPWYAKASGVALNRRFEEG